LREENVMAVLQAGSNRHRLLRFRGRPTISVIYPPREFNEIIKRECVRSDRYHTRFSLAVFKVGAQDKNSALIRCLVRTIHHRFRATDDVGWYRRGQIGVMMPFTPLESAWKLAEYVSNIISSLMPLPPFTIYAYPSDNWPKQHRLQDSLASMRIFAMVDRLLTPPTLRSDELHALIASERGRADRNGNIFSLSSADGQSATRHFSSATDAVALGNAETATKSAGMTTGTLP
ncbi:MAG: hypothetical protein L7F78_07640, partial [Syntrophales bacterium LBB04]|nr:hypothetical protein [Syntrophales bacterium LBB04]